MDHKGLAKDQLAFLAVFVVKLGLGLVAFAIKPWLGILFLATYGLYVWREIASSDTAPEEEELEPLKLKPKNPSMAWAGLQTVIALCVIGAASHIFVSQLEGIGVLFGLPPQIVALLLSPVATELPEIMNALIWVRQGKERLALANISGAMMIQATIPSALGMFFTPWLLDAPLLIAGAITALAVLMLWLVFRRGNVQAKNLMAIALLYCGFAGYVAWYFMH